jgi:hypothetical protein
VSSGDLFIDKGIQVEYDSLQVNHQSLWRFGDSGLF